MSFPAQTRTDIQALAACRLPVLAATSGAEGGTAVFANAAAVAALTGHRAEAAWTALDDETLTRFGPGRQRFAPPYANAPGRFDIAAAGPGGPIRWRLSAWVLQSADDAATLVAVAADASAADATFVGEPTLALSAMEDAASAGSVWSEPARGCLTLSPGAAALWSLEPGAAGLGDLLARVHPDDAADLLASEAVEEDGRREFRIIGSDGGTIYVARLSRPLPRTAGGPRRILHVDRDVTTMRTLERDLIQTRTEAEVGARSKSEFLSLMSHELRTPLNAVMGFAQVMAAEMFGPLAPRYLEYSREIGRSAEHLLTIINDILDLTRIEAARVQISKEWLDFGRLAAETARMMTETARQKQVEMRIDPADAVRTWGEKRALRQLTLNLLSNAIKFTDPGGVVTLTVRETEDGTATLSVSDTGIGIPEEDLPTIFRPFVQASNAMGRAEAGTGLGLAIVRALVDLHDGRIAVESTLGEGTTITVSLPRAYDPANVQGEARAGAATTA